MTASWELRARPLKVLVQAGHWALLAKGISTVRRERPQMIVEENHRLGEEANDGWDSRIRVIQCGDLVRSYLIETERFVVVYDTLLGPVSGGWLRDLALTVADGKPLVVMNSHSDWDHCYGNMCFPEPILGSRECVNRLRGIVGQKELATKCEEEPSYQKVELVPPAICLTDECVIDGGDLTLQILETTGHRPDHLALYIPEISTLFPGDCVEDPIPLVDEDSATDVQTIADLQKSLERMLALKPQWVLANHASPQNGVGRLQANAEYLKRLSDVAASSASLEALRQRLPVNPQWPDFYQKAHLKHLRFGWEQRPGF